MYDPQEVPEVLPAGDISHLFSIPLNQLRFWETPDDPTEIRQVQATYYGMVTEVDAQNRTAFECLISC